MGRGQSFSACQNLQDVPHNKNCLDQNISCTKFRKSDGWGQNDYGGFSSGEAEHANSSCLHAVRSGSNSLSKVWFQPLSLQHDS